MFGEPPPRVRLGSVTNLKRDAPTASRTRRRHANMQTAAGRDEAHDQRHARAQQGCNQYPDQEVFLSDVLEGKPPLPDGSNYIGRHLQARRSGGSVRQRHGLGFVVVGSGWRFTSGISYYTCRLTNALSQTGSVGAILMRQLVPSYFYPGRARIGSELHNMSYAEDVPVVDGIDWHGRGLPRSIRFLFRERPRVVVLQWWTGAVLHWYLLLAVFARLRGSFVVIEWHEVQDTGELKIPGAKRYVDVLMRLLLRMTNGYVVHSEFDRVALAARFSLGSRPTVVAPHGPYEHHAVTAREIPRQPEDPVQLLYFGVIRPYKGVEDLVEAFGNLSRDDAERFRLKLVGETWEGWTKPLDLVASNPHRDLITVVNRYVSDDEVSRHFSEADAVVLPYRRSSASGPLHIAMAAGLPVIVSAVGGLVEAVGDYPGALTFAAGDTGELTQRLLEVPSLVGRQFEDPHTWDKTVLAYQELSEALSTALSGAHPSE